ncbi:MAG TPA: hypothetical protein PKY59_08955 [Pyrinomonadaceae bacterium]|nr:hypothetical protein [Pyrinomonadaceae bacterium]
MKTNGKTLLNSVITTFVVLLFLTFDVFAQSTDQLFPTPITSNEISGKIKARDLGDSRLTTFYYTFNGEQGDVFINVVTNNFSGDIDVFSIDGAKTFTKIVVYADASSNETGRVVYLRKSEKLLLRIEGRSPNDDDAAFRIKFAGSFQAVNDAKNAEQPKLPEIKEDTSSGIRVNSVGTIVEVIQKPKPLPKEVPAKAEEKVIEKGVVKEITLEADDEKAVVAETSTEPQKNVENAVETATKTETTAKVEKKPKTKPIKEKTAEIKKEKEKKAEENAAKNEAETKTQDADKKEEVKTEKTAEKTAKAEKPKKPKTEKAAEIDPLSNIRLIVLFKDGTKIERPMSEILKFGVEKGILTVISKDGTIGRYSILEVVKMTVE